MATVESKASLTLARYRRPFVVDGIACEVVITANLRGLDSVLRIDGEVVARDHTSAMGADAVRNHRLAGQLANGRPIEVEAGYINWVNCAIAVRSVGELLYESHPGRRIAYPASAAKMVVDADGKANMDLGQFKRNRVPIAVDILLGLLFFAVAKLTDLSTAALVGAAAGITLVVAQRFVKVDLIGGLALFGVVMLLISAGLALVFQDDMAVKLRTTIVGSISATLFLLDGLLGGNRLGKGLARYVPYTDIDPKRLAIGMGLLGLAMAGLNYGVARLASTDLWLFYSTFVDFFLIMLLVLLVFRYARGKPLLGRSRSREPRLPLG